jgi:hypothetical protein
MVPRKPILAAAQLVQGPKELVTIHCGHFDFFFDSAFDESSKVQIRFLKQWLSAPQGWQLTNCYSGGLILQKIRRRMQQIQSVRLNFSIECGL